MNFDTFANKGGLGMVGGALNLASNFLGRSQNASEVAAKRQYKYALDLQNRANEFSERMYRNRYTYMREDMENAKINPLIGLGGATAPSGTAGSVAMGTDAQEKLGIKQNYLQGLTVGDRKSVV